MKTFEYHTHDLPTEFRERLKEYERIYIVAGMDPCIMVYQGKIAGTQTPDGIIIVSNVEGKPWHIAEMSWREFNARLVNITKEDNDFENNAR